jgi:cytochrome P450 family 9
MILDPELIKQITIKDFDHFLNHRNQIDENIDPLFSRNLFSMDDNKWRVMRSTLRFGFRSKNLLKNQLIIAWSFSPAFTGSKMRLMFQIMADCTLEHMDNILKDVKNKPLDIETKELFQR